MKATKAVVKAAASANSTKSPLEIENAVLKAENTFLKEKIAKLQKTLAELM